MRYILRLPDGSEVRDPDPNRFGEYLNALSSDAPFLVLEGQSDQHFVQAYWTDDDSFALEYRAGDSDHHFETPSPVPMREVLRALHAFAAGEKLESLHDWQALDF